MARLSEDKLLAEIERSWNLGIRNFCLFPAVEEHLKDKTASHSWADDNFYLRIARNSVKARFPECSLMSDVAMDPYSSDGHDGVVTARRAHRQRGHASDSRPHVRGPGAGRL